MRASAAAVASTSSAGGGGGGGCSRRRSQPAARHARTAAWAGLLVLVPLMLFSGYGGAPEPNQAGAAASANAAPPWLQRRRGGPPPVVEAATRCLASLEGSILFQGGAQMWRVADAVAEVAGLVRKAEGGGGGADVAYLFRTPTGILAHLSLFAQRDGARGAATTAAVYTARTLLSEESAAPHEYVVVHPAMWEPTACKGARYFYLALRKQLAAAKATLRQAANAGDARGPARKRLLVAGLDWEVEARCANMTVAKADGLGLTSCAACVTPEKVAAYRDAMVLAARCAGAEVAVYSETGLEQVKASFRPLAQQTARMEALSMIEALCTPQAQRERRANPHGKGGGGGADDDSTASFYEALSCADEEKLLKAWDADKELSTCRCVEHLPPPPPPPPPSSSLATAAPASAAPHAARAARRRGSGQQRLLVYSGAVEAHKRAVARLNPRLSPSFYEASHSRRVEAGGGALSVVEVEQTAARRGLTRWAEPPLCTALAEAFPGAAVEKEEWRVAVVAAAAAAAPGGGGGGSGTDARRKTGGKPVVPAGGALTTRGDNSARDPTPEEVGKYWWRPDGACRVHAFSRTGVQRCLAGVRVAAVGGSELQETVLTLAGLGDLGVALRTNFSDENPAGVGSFRVGAQQRKAEGYWRAPVGGGGGGGASFPPPARVHSSLLLGNATRAVDFYWAPSVFSHVGGGPAAAGALRASLRGAGAVLLQYGLWDAAHGGVGAGVAEFYAALSARVAEVRAEAAAGTRVFLVDPRHVWPARCKSRYGARARCHACLAPAAAAAYREAVHLAAACAGVPVVSTHDLFRSLPQHTEDGVHYAPSALALEGQLLLNVLCTREHHRPMQAVRYEGCREQEALRKWEKVEAQPPECGESRGGGVE